MKVCPHCLNKDIEIDNGTYTCHECGTSGSEKNLCSIADEIPIEGIQIGLKTGVVEIVYDEGYIDGIGCRIEDNMFYFEFFESSEPNSLEDYFENYCPSEKVAEHIYNCIGTPEKAEYNCICFDEWLYYLFVIEELSDEKHSLGMGEYESMS